MSKFTALDEALYAYLVAHRSPDDEALHVVYAEAARRPEHEARMQIAPEQGALLTLLARLMGARRALEIGTFTGLSALCIARGLGPDGRLLALDVNAEYAAVARRHWELAGVSERIELRLGRALDSLRALPREPLFDLAFLDADKVGYLDYYEELLPRLRVGGLLVADNVLWSGAVVQADALDAETTALRRFNDLVVADARVEALMIAVADGLLLARRRG
jgi:caffeoyl-CoA O-methyltransferase